MLFFCVKVYFTSSGSIKFYHGIVPGCSDVEHPAWRQRWQYYHAHVHPHRVRGRLVDILIVVVVIVIVVSKWWLQDANEMGSQAWCYSSLSRHIIQVCKMLHLFGSTFRHGALISSYISKWCLQDANKMGSQP